MFLDMSKPKPFKKYSICIKSLVSQNAKTFSIYGDKLTLEQLEDLLKIMIIDERKIYIDDEERYILSGKHDKRKSYTHTTQIFEFDVEDFQKVNDSASFCFSEFVYSSNEIVDKLRLRFGKKREFVEGKALDYLKKCLEKNGIGDN